jgi:hypothetical protein
VQVYGVTGRTDTLLTYPKTPPADCLSVEGGDVTTDPRGKPHRSNKSTVNVCSGTVSKLGYLTAEFKP